MVARLGDERRIMAPDAARARSPADTHRCIELRAGALIELVGQEVRGLQRRVPLRRQVVEPEAVVERVGCGSFQLSCA